MKTFRSIAAVFVFAAIFAVSAFAQSTVPVQPGGVAKIVVIDTRFFGGSDEKGTGGISRFISANASLTNEFKPIQQDLDSTGSKLQTMQKELQTLQDQITAGTVPVNQKTFQAKADAFQALKTEYARKQEDAKAKYERRQAELLGPVTDDIGKALDDFIKQKGYGMVFDSNKLYSAGVLLASDDKFDVTKEFIAFYNARPATAAK